MTHQVSLLRLKSTAQGTPGYWIFPGGWYYSMELPWRDNLNSLSCIPEGVYTVAIRKSPKYGKVYHVKNVPGRSYILIHPLNVAGNIEMGYKTESEGCIGLGKRLGMLWGQRAVLVSRPTVRTFMEAMDYQPFILHVRNTYGSD